MRTLILFFFCTQAFASTTVTFSKDGARASVAMTAMGDNPDAVNLFNVLTQAAKNFGGRLSKRVTFVDNAGAKALDISCVVSANYKTMGNCVVTFFRSTNVQLDSSQHHASLILHESEAERFAKEFTIQGAPLVYQSEDSHLQVVVAAPSSLEVHYQ